MGAPQRVASLDTRHPRRLCAWSQAPTQPALFMTRSRLVNEYAGSLGKVKEAPPTFTTKEPAYDIKDTPHRPRRHPKLPGFVGGTRSGSPRGDRCPGRPRVRRHRAAHPQALCHLRCVVVCGDEALHQRLHLPRLLTIARPATLAA